MKYRLYYKNHYGINSYSKEEAENAKERMVKAGHKANQIKIVSEQKLFN